MSTLVLETHHFDAWEHHLSQTIGHHKSRLLTPDIPFASRLEVASASAITVVAVSGRSSVRLSRSQPYDNVVLWLPQRGWVADHVNGRLLVAEPGAAMFCLPGDDLVGDTSLCLKGISLLLPTGLFGDIAHWRASQRRLLQNGPEELALIHMAYDLVDIVRRGDVDPAFSLKVLLDQILYWQNVCLQEGGDRGHPVDRRVLISQAREWIQAHLSLPFRVAELASALHVAPRTLQLAFREQLGRSPMSEVQRLRFVALRRWLLLPPPEEQTLEEIFPRFGLVVSSLTQRRYCDWCGESPQQTRARGNAAPHSDHRAG